MTDKAIRRLRRRLIEDMAIRRLSLKTQLHYIRHVKRFADFLGRSADKAAPQDVHRYQLWLASIGTSSRTMVTARCATLSSKVGMPSGLCEPSALGTYARRTGGA